MLFDKFMIVTQLLLAIINAYVAVYYSLDDWVTFKTFIIPIYTLVTVGLASIILMKGFKN